MVHHPGSATAVNMAVSERKSTRCDFSVEWNAAPRSDAKRLSYPDVKSRILESQDSGTIRNRYDSALRALGPMRFGVSAVSVSSPSAHCEHQTS